MERNKGKMSWSETIRLTRRAFKTYYKSNPVHVIMFIATMAWDSHTVCGNIFVGTHH